MTYTALAKRLKFSKKLGCGLILWAMACIAQADVFLDELSGERISFASLHGKWVFINYWATWCQPCVEEIASFNQLIARHKNVAVFAVHYETMPLSKQKRFIKRLHIQYPSLTHSVTRTLHLGPIDVVPTTFVFNPQGKLYTTLYGGQKLSDLEEVLIKKPH